jgi:hypothetical protein
MPCYELYGKPADEAGGDGMIQSCLKVVMDEERRVVHVHPNTHATGESSFLPYILGGLSTYGVFFASKYIDSQSAET